MTALVVQFLAISVLAVWFYLLAWHGAFWCGEETDKDKPPAPEAWPDVVAVVPARDEARGIEQTIASLLRQDYAGRFTIVLVDDQSRDGTAAVAAETAAESGASDRLIVVPGAALPAGWTGKVWAQHQGIEAARGKRPFYLWLTDADIVHAPDTLSWLVAKAQSKGLVLTSLMAKLRCVSLAEQSLVPAFILFFQKLYPFQWVNDPANGTAAAAGGCMLVRADAMDAIGGIASIKDALIDDCALARKLKTQGSIWLGLTDRARSTRDYPGFGDIRRMVSRSAYAQLRYSPLLLLGTVAGMMFLYVAPVALTIYARGWPQLLGLLAWVFMVFGFLPTLWFYRRSVLWAWALPMIAMVYLVFTLDSAYQHARGRGGMWKGRAQANVGAK